MNGLVGWFVTGAVTGIVAPLAVLASRGRLDRFGLPPALSAAGFVLVHAAITASLLFDPPPPAWVVEHLVLLSAAVVFWLPILSRTRRLSGDVVLVYGLASSPLLDLAAVAVIGFGRPDYGLAMLSGMLPLNAAVVGVVWRWMRAEERTADADLLGSLESRAQQLDLWSTDHLA